MKIQIDAQLLVNFIAGVLGEDSEVVVHDLANINASLVAISNGHLSGRQIGAPATDLALRMVQEYRQSDGESYKLNYRSKTHRGVLLRSSTLIIKGENGEPAAMLCINTDDKRLLDVQEALRKLMPNEPEQSHQESLSMSVDDVGQDILQSVLEQYPITPSRMSAEEKSQVVKDLEQRGLFSIRGFVAKTAQILEISEPTLYRYLKNS
ncbi:helix-turn-helix transcriptional regulator [Deefgea salmonis]|uniref:PAS domain-containing protein n=1 Tax=Deefgea salmonis TaxID=2875502 RepID=A0ABS8BNU8_9NEIS|nr:PAS domain-containing protein [Deefgea salmonis]MCB5197400.1 PAS domain-containing protein [Deefgea salmonis]